MTITTHSATASPFHVYRLLNYGNTWQADARPINRKTGAPWQMWRKLGTHATELDAREAIETHRAHFAQKHEARTINTQSA